MEMMTLYVKQQKRHRCINRLLESVGEGEGGMIWENGNSNMYTVTPVFLPGESQGRGSLVGCRLMGSHRVGHD